MGTIEQRQHTRTDVRLSAEIQVPNGMFTATTKNVSVGGAALECEKALKDGATIKLSLFIVVDGIEDARHPPLITNAKVMWTGEGDDGSHTAGVRFEGMTPAQAQWLEKFLSQTGAGG
jgi:c-di-GMP-binding flagellar brake protein YcgR